MAHKRPAEKISCLAAIYGPDPANFDLGGQQFFDEFTQTNWSRASPKALMKN